MWKDAVWIDYCTSHIPTIDGNLFGRASFMMVYHMPGWHHHFLKNTQRADHQIDSCVWKISRSRPQIEAQLMQIFQKINGLFEAYCFEGWKWNRSKKIRAIVNWPRPTTVTDVCSFLGFTNHYRRFIHKYTHIARPLNVLISGDNANKKKQAIKWNKDCEESFQKLKQLFSSTPFSAYADYSKPFKLQTDTCNLGLGAVLYQTSEDGLDRVIAYASRTLSKWERNYPAYKLEFLALKWAVTDWFHEYLYGGNLHVYTDNNPLTYILTSAKLYAVGHHWVAALSNYNFQLHYKTGKSNVEADALSWIPWQKARSEFQDLGCLTVKAIIMGTTTKIPLIEAYAGRTVIPPQKDNLFYGKVGIDQNPPITNQ